MNDQQDGAVAAPSEASILEALRPVEDPEVGLSIVDMGLIYGVKLGEDGSSVQIDMTLTSPMCPLGPQILSATHAAAAEVPGVSEVSVELVWDPPWDPAEMASDEVKDHLGIW